MRLLRRLFVSLNLLTTLALLGTLFIMANFVSSRRYTRWDLTRQKITAISDKTQQMLRSLKEPVNITVFYLPSHRLYELIHDELEEYQRANPLIKVEYLDPQQDVARAKQLAQQFQIEELNVVVFQSGSRHKYLSDTDLAEYDYSEMRVGAEQRVKAFKGEEAFTSAILSVTQTAGSLVWLTSGHGEKSLALTDTSGISDLKRYLEQQNMLVDTVTLLEHPTIPATVKLLMIIGPTRRFTETELVTLEQFLENGGRLLALIDPLDDTGLDGLLHKWGVDLGLDIVVDPARQIPFVSAANLFVTTYTEHPIVRKMKTLATLFPLARSIRMARPLPKGVTATALALTSEQGWGETKTAVEQFQFNPAEDLKGPVSIAVASERLAPAHARLVVLGDSDFVINGQLGNAGNRDLLLGAVFWLTEQEQLIGVGPKAIESVRLNLTSPQMTQLFWFSFFGMPAVLGALGLGMWWFRRT